MCDKSPATKPGARSGANPVGASFQAADAMLNNTCAIKGGDPQPLRVRPDSHSQSGQATDPVTKLPDISIQPATLEIATLLEA
jgi:hypothetical protein